MSHEPLVHSSKSLFLLNIATSHAATECSVCTFPSFSQVANTDEITETSFHYPWQLSEAKPLSLVPTQHQ